MNQRAPLLTSEPPYAEAIEMWEAFWRLEDLGRPLWQIPTPPVETLFEARLVPMLPLIQDRAFQLRASLNFLQWRQALAIGDDWVPHLQPYQGVTPLPSAFGCPVHYFDHTSPWVDPLIRAEDPPEKVYDLPAPAVTDGQLGKLLEYTDYFTTETGGRYPISTYLQGPMDMAYLVWDSSAFMLAMYTNPKEVHHLLRLVTDLTIAFVKELRARSPQFFACHCPPLWMAEGQGVSVSEDCSAVLSPKLWREFSLPYVNEISEEFGGVVIHSCGNFLHQFDNLAQVHNLRGLNFGASETPFEAIWERFGGKTAILPHLGLNKDFPFGTHEEFMEHIFRTVDHWRGLCIVAAPPALSAQAETAGHRAGVGPEISDQAFISHFLQTTRETLERHIGGR
jgi:hypothetical protein